jgi:hypothetical protein
MQRRGLRPQAKTIMVASAPEKKSRRYMGIPDTLEL